MEGPLKGLRVLDLTIARAGPTAVRLLSDWGADVVKVEPIPQKEIPTPTPVPLHQKSWSLRFHRDSGSCCKILA